MFTIEHTFDATVITLIDEGEAPLCEDVTIESHDAGVTLLQTDPDTDEVMVIHMSPRQVQELRAALNLPEGIYRLRPTGDGTQSS
ncbi:MAG: hypothetical protein Kow0013_12470 [Pararhodobacter sp.]